MNKIKAMLKRFWNWLLGKTTVDEKVVETYHEVKEKVEDVVEDVKEAVEEVKTRAKRVKQEAADVVEAAKEVVKQSKDVVDAAKGGKRKGRRPAPKKVSATEGQKRNSSNKK